MKQLWQYIKNPQENCPYDFNVRVMLLSVMLCLLAPLFFKVLTVSVFVIAGVDLPAMISDKSVLPRCFLIIIPPIIEELGFRLPLKRSRFNLYTSVAVIAFIFSKVIFAGGLYSEHLLCRIVFAIISSAVINLIWGKWLLQVRFKDFFYSTAILFAQPSDFRCVTVAVCCLLCLCQDSRLHIIWICKNKTRNVIQHSCTYNQQFAGNG